MAWPPEPNEPQPPPMPQMCQSCGMPMARKADFGTNADGTKNDDYCIHCFKEGKFTRPDMTLTQMIELIASMAPRMKMSESDARAMATKNLPRLKRWKK